MNEKTKVQLIELYESGGTDSAIEEFCDENNIQYKDAFDVIAKHKSPSCCKNCKYENQSHTFYPCCCCSRGKDDLYEAE